MQRKLWPWADNSKYVKSKHVLDLGESTCICMYVCTFIDSHEKNKTF